jgi:predicted esterase
MHLLLLISLLAVADDDRLAPPGHARNPSWVGGIVPPALIDLFAPMTFKPKGGRFAAEVFHYRLFQPQDANRSNRYPLLIWASGYGEKGDNNFAQLRHLHYVFHDRSSGERANFYCLVMQVPERHENWIEPKGEDVANVLMSLADDIQKRFPIDADRIYLSGVSAGGSVCWELLQRHPHKFAAVAPLASGGGGENRERLAGAADVPVWAFHAARDPLSPIEPVRQTVEALTDAGGIVHLTEVDSDYHDCWTIAFQDNRLMDWLLAQRRGGICWLRPGWTPIYLRELGVLFGVPLLVVAAITSERRRRRRAKAAIPQAISALILLAVTTGCEPPPPGRAEPYGPDLYVRGDFFTSVDPKADEDDAAAAIAASWDVCDKRNRLRYLGKDRYEATLELPAGEHQFKIADQTWHAITLGGWPNAAVMDLETPYGMLLSDGSANLVIETPDAATYRFTLHAENRKKPLLTIEQVPEE